MPPLQSKTSPSLWSSFNKPGYSHVKFLSKSTMLTGIASSLRSSPWVRPRYPQQKRTYSRPLVKSKTPSTLSESFLDRRTRRRRSPRPLRRSSKNTRSTYWTLSTLTDRTESSWLTSPSSTAYSLLPYEMGNESHLQAGLMPPSTLPASARKDQHGCSHHHNGIGSRSLKTLTQNGSGRLAGSVLSPTEKRIPSKHVKTGMANVVVNSPDARELIGAHCAGKMGTPKATATIVSREKRNENRDWY